MSVFWLSDEELNLFDASLADENGLVAIGLNLSIPVLLMAYSRGIFPWFEDSDEIFWFSPDPRMVLYPDQFRVSHSLKQVLRSNRFEVRVDTNFREVIRKCAATKRKNQDGTWISSTFEKAYFRLHQEGFAHSFETYQGNKLVGGLYGVSIGRVFFGESMFFDVPNASKAALAFLVKFCKYHQIKLIDAQQETEHLKSVGAITVSRNEFIEQVQALIEFPTLKGLWKQLFMEMPSN